MWRASRPGRAQTTPTKRQDTGDGSRSKATGIAVRQSKVISEEAIDDSGTITMMANNHLRTDKAMSYGHG